MASPQLENGYTRIANELVEALAGIRLSGREFQVVMAVVRLTYGFHKREDSISYGQIAKLTGIPRRNVIRTVQSLVSRMTLYSVASDTRRPSTIGINKDYSEWIPSVTHDTSVTSDTTPGVTHDTRTSVTHDTHQRKKDILKKKTKTYSASKIDAAHSDNGNSETFFMTRRKRKLSGKRLEAFEKFWDAFAYKKGKAEAADAWLDIPQLTNSTVEKILCAAKAEATAREEIIRSGKIPKMAQGWISGRRWEDEVIVPGSSSFWAEIDREMSNGH